MKLIIKRLSLFIVLVLSLVLLKPINTFAAIDQTSYVNINNIESLEVGELSFSDISFKDHSSSSTKAFGLTGTIYNSSSMGLNYTSTVYYYDANYKLLAEGTFEQFANTGTSYYNVMSNLTVLGEHQVNEVYYYRLIITTSDNQIIELVDPSSNTPSKNSQFKYNDYVIDKYDINIIVNENNTFDITETITAYFNIPKHGIIRTIPLKNTIKRLDGTSSTNRTQLTNLSIDNKYTDSKTSKSYKIQIGDANQTITGEQTYVIKYTYNLGKDPVKDYDELYYNLIGDEWDTAIGNVTFTITMPKSFDSSKLGFSSGKTGSIANSNVKYSVSGNTITGSYDGILNTGEALTVRCELPEGYFVNAKLNIKVTDYIMFAIPIVFLIISIALWFIFGRDNKVVETVEFYPPEGFNSLEIGFLYKGKADSQDVISLLIYLANKGYLKITETEEKSLFSTTKGFKITKLKEYDGNNLDESMFFNGLFTKKTTIPVLFGKTE